jgi:Cdc6-like AAA superfamily ATPase
MLVGSNMVPRRSVLSQANLVAIRSQLPTVFTPSAPVARRELFAGRPGQIQSVLGAVFQEAQHAVLFGERGVGKTSLTSLIDEFWNEIYKDADLVAPRVNCDTTDTFGTIWSKVAEEIELSYKKRRLDLASGIGDASDVLWELKSGSATPNLIRRFVELSDKSFVIILDEFDRLQDEAAPRLFADTIKTLSDHLTDATLVLVGVADTIEGLIAEHASVDRNLVQVLMPRMSIEELMEIPRNGLQSVGMTVSEDTARFIARLAQGLPHYAHLFTLHASIHAVEQERLQRSS